PSSSRSVPARNLAPTSLPAQTRSNTGQFIPGTGRHTNQGDRQPDKARRVSIQNAIVRVTALRHWLSFLNDQDYATVFAQLGSCIPNVHIAGSYSERRIAYPVFCKVMFFLMVDQYSSGEFRAAVRSDPSIEVALDNSIRNAYGHLPPFSGNDIDLSRS